MMKTKRARRAGFAVGIAAAASMAFGASSAQAAPVAFANIFDNAALKTTFPGNGFDILEPSTPADGADPPASVAGSLETTTGLVTIPAGCTAPGSAGVHNGVGFCFPDFSGTVSGIPISVSLDTIEPMLVQADGGIITPTGGATGQPTDFVAVLDVAGDICTIGDPPGAPDDPDMTLTFDTDAASYPNPYSGDLFDVPFHTGMDYPPLQNGAIAANWASLPPAVPAPGDDCSLVNGLIGGPGGIWIAEGLGNPTANQPPPPPPTTSGGGLVTTPKKDTGSSTKKCKKGQKLKKGKCVKKKKKKKK